MFIASMFSNYLDQANCTTLSSKVIVSFAAKETTKVTDGQQTSLKTAKMGKYSESGG